MSDFSITVVDVVSGRTEVLPFDPNTSMQEVIGFCQAIFGLDEGIRLFKDGKPLSTSATLRSAGKCFLRTDNASALTTFWCDPMITVVYYVGC